jgi:hypothetical protein
MFRKNGIPRVHGCTGAVMFRKNAQNIVPDMFCTPPSLEVSAEYQVVAMDQLRFIDITQQ